MNFQKKKKLNVPENLEKFLIELTVEILINNPVDLNEFGYNYFRKIIEKKADVETTQCLPMEAAEKKSEVANNNFSEEVSDIDDELLDFDWEVRKKSQSRRCSVFSRSYDPSKDCPLDEDNDKSLHSDESLDGNVEAYEITKNRPFEKRKDFEKTAAQKSQLKSILQSIVIFKFLYSHELDEIIEAMFPRECEKDEIIIHEGDSGYYFYVIFSGVYEIFIKQISTFENSETESIYGKKYGEYKETGFFGELSLLYDQPRAATIISTGPGLLFCMNRDKFKTLVIRSAFTRGKNYENFLLSMPLLTFSLDRHEITQVADSLVTQEYKQDDCIFKQNDDAHGMYFIEKGSVKITREEVTENGVNTVQIRVLGKGEFFGELALVNNTKRSASAFAQCESESVSCRLAFLEVEAFERIIGPCREFIKYKIISYSNVC